MRKRRKRAVRQVVVRCDLQAMVITSDDHKKRLPAVELRIRGIELALSELAAAIGKPEIVERHVGDVLLF